MYICIYVLYIYIHRERERDHVLERYGDGFATNSLIAAQEACQIVRKEVRTTSLEKAARPSVIWDLHRDAKTSMRGTPQNIVWPYTLKRLPRPLQRLPRRRRSRPAAAWVSVFLGKSSSFGKEQQAFPSRRGEGFGVARRVHAAFDEGSLAGYCLVFHFCSSPNNEER